METGSYPHILSKRARQVVHMESRLQRLEDDIDRLPIGEDVTNLPRYERFKVKANIIYGLGNTGLRLASIVFPYTIAHTQLAGALNKAEYPLNLPESPTGDEFDEAVSRAAQEIVAKETI